MYIDVQPGHTDEPVVVQTERGVQVSGRVLDPQGQPLGNIVVHAIITDPADTYSPYFWAVDKYGTPTPAVTDAAGIATVSYPRFVEPGQRTGAISFRAEHPDFCAVRPTNYRVDAPGDPEPVTLHRGAT